MNKPICPLTDSRRYTLAIWNEQLENRCRNVQCHYFLNPILDKPTGCTYTPTHQEPFGEEVFQEIDFNALERAKKGI